MLLNIKKILRSFTPYTVIAFSFYLEMHESQELGIALQRTAISFILVDS